MNTKHLDTHYPGDSHKRTNSVMNTSSAKAAINYLTLVSLIYIVVTVMQKVFEWII